MGGLCGCLLALRVCFSPHREGFSVQIPEVVQEEWLQFQRSKSPGHIQARQELCGRNASDRDGSDSCISSSCSAQDHNRCLGRSSKRDEQLGKSPAGIPSGYGNVQRWFDAGSSAHVGDWGCPSLSFQEGTGRFCWH